MTPDLFNAVSVDSQMDTRYRKRGEGGGGEKQQSHTLKVRSVGRFLGAGVRERALPQRVSRCSPKDPSGVLSPDVR